MNYLGVDIDVVQADLLGYSADLLALKYAQASYGVDEIVARIAGLSETELPETGSELLLQRPFSLAYHHVLFLGVEPLAQFDYRSIRDFSLRALTSATEISPPVRKIVMTLHGAGFGLDEVEAFESELAGIVEAIDSGRYPRSLLAVTILEANAGRADRMRQSLAALLKPVDSSRDLTGNKIPDTETEARRIDSVGYDSAARPHAFVAMPFNDSYDDIFHYGIAPPVRAAGLLCERMDQISFTGDVVSQMKERISSARLVIADLSETNANVYLEIGYAWGVQVPCVLICNRNTELKFDLQGQRCLRYNSIKGLEDALTADLQALTAQPSSWRGSR